MRIRCRGREIVWKVFSDCRMGRVSSAAHKAEMVVGRCWVTLPLEWTMVICSKSAKWRHLGNAWSSMLFVGRTGQLSSVHTSNNVEATHTPSSATSRFFRQNRMLLRQIRTCLTWNEHETKWTCSICFDVIERTKFHEKVVRHCCQKRQQCRSNVQLCRKNRSTCSIRPYCFDIVIGVNLSLIHISEPTRPY